MRRKIDPRGLGIYSKSPSPPGAAHTIRVATSAEPGFFDRENMVTVPRSGPRTPFTVKPVPPNGLVLQTSSLKAWVRRSGSVAFTDFQGRHILIAVTAR